jgi:hypothetical protein
MRRGTSAINSSPSGDGVRSTCVLSNGVSRPRGQARTCVTRASDLGAQSWPRPAESVARYGSESRPELGAAGVSEREPVAILPQAVSAVLPEVARRHPREPSSRDATVPRAVSRHRPAACTRERPGNFCHSERFCRPRQKRLAILIATAAETVSHCKKMS